MKMLKNVLKDDDMNKLSEQGEIDPHKNKSRDQLLDEISRLNTIIRTQADKLNNSVLKGGEINPSDIFKPAFVCYEPEEIKRMRKIFGESPKEFAKRFGVGDSAVKSWETPRFHEDGKTKRSKHAECLGAAGKLMYWAAVVANERGSGDGNLIRIEMRG